MRLLPPLRRAGPLRPLRAGPLRRRWASSAPSPRTQGPNGHQDGQGKRGVDGGSAALPLGLGLLAYTFLYPRLGASKSQDADADQGCDDDDDDDGSSPPAKEAREGLIAYHELQRHDSPSKGLWVLINGEVWDLTDFYLHHAGGPNVVLQHAGSDVSSIFNPVHPGDAIKRFLSPSQKVGDIDPLTLPRKKLSDQEKQRRERLAHLPPLSSILNLEDFEKVAQSVLTPQGWMYYRTAADDEISYHHNRTSFGRIWFRPRILVPIEQVDATTTILSTQPENQQIKLSTPFYISPAAAAKFGHSEGELNLTRAAGDAGVLQGISANASYSLDDILHARKHGQPIFYQLYLNKDRRISEDLLQHLEREGVQAVMLTVDSPVMGNRERELRAADREAVATPSTAGGYFEQNLSWDLVQWFRKTCNMPLFIKGIQCIEDVATAAEHGVDGVVLSNHGGRSLDYAPSGMDILIELREKRPDLFDKLDVYVDGGVRRGTDVLKALALGARAVGLGRPFLFANSGYGQEGAAHAIALLKAEVERGMRFLGVRSLEELTPDRIRILPLVFASNAGASSPPFLHGQSASASGP